MIALSIGRARACALTCCLWLGSGCGGAQPEPAAASKRTGDERPQKVAEPAAPEPEPEPARPSCDDGGCFVCGSGSCPSGWYCDESASGGPACSWLPGCGSKLSCACASKALGSGCSCSEEAGGLHVSCK